MSKTRVKLIPLALAKPGMVLAQEVRNQQGQVLLQVGADLSASSISILIKRNIVHVSVWHEDDRSEEELAAERIKVTERINRLFRNTAADGTMGALRQMILDYRLEMLS
jgi:hypothetical protein